MAVAKEEVGVEVYLCEAFLVSLVVDMQVYYSTVCSSYII